MACSKVKVGWMDVFEVSFGFLPARSLDTHNAAHIQQLKVRETTTIDLNLSIQSRVSGMSKTDLLETKTFVLGIINVYSNF
jgi:hypothetical protein